MRQFTPILLRIIVYVLITTVILYIFVTNRVHDYAASQHSRLPTAIHHSTPSQMDFDEIQKGRLDWFYEACSSINYTYNKNYTQAYYNSWMYQFSYCKVQKVASTFFTQMFEIFELFIQDYSGYENVFKRARKQLHAGSVHLPGIRPFSKEFNKSRVIIVSRHPYSRLFSGYIDKIFVPVLNTVSDYASKHDINQTKQKCLPVPSFQSFLDRIIEQAQKGKKLNRHWAPLMTMCKPCDTHPFLLLKLESFVSDIKGAMTKLGFDKKLYEILMKAVDEKRVEYSVPGIIEENFDIFNRLYNNSQYQTSSKQLCIDRMSFSSRIWQALQIQGVIDPRVQFPSSSLPPDFNASIFTALVLETTKQHPLDSSARHAQRQAVMSKAYGSVKKETIKAIQDIFFDDFYVFGYDIALP